MNEAARKAQDIRPFVAERLRRLALGLVAALLVARPVLVSEDAADGSGLWFAQLWLGTALLWAVWQVARGELKWRFHPIDLAVLVLLLAVAGAATRAAAVRPAINMAWEWAGLACIYFLVRQLPQSAGENGGLAVVVLAMAVALSGYSLYESVWVQPRTKADYLAHRARYLRQLGIEAGTGEARRFEDRLLFTHEPIATFASTNSLAGFVLPWLLVGIGWAVGGEKRRPLGTLPRRGGGPWRGEVSATLACRFALVLSLLLMAICLFLTKSRAAWGGAIAGVALWLFLQRRILSVRGCVGLLLGVALIIAAGVAAISLGRGFDRFLVTTAMQAISYRVQYWQGAWGVIREHPWLGVGPGNFQQHYMAHKQPQSSEEIADPHNLFLELWSTSGIFAALALAVALGAFLWILWRAVRCANAQGQLVPDRDEPEASSHFDRLFLVGGVGGFLLVILLGVFMLVPGEARPSVLILLIALWLAAFLVIAVAVRGIPLPRAALLSAVVALTVNLLATGGIAFPAVAQNLWLLIALGLNVVSPGGVRVLHGPLLALPVAALAGAVFAAAHVTATGPVTACNAEMNTAGWHLQSRSVSTAVEHLRRAVRSDPLSPQPLRALADVLFGQSRELRLMRGDEKGQALLEQQADDKFQAAVDLAREAVERDRHRPSMHWWLAQQFVEHYYATGDPSSAESAADTLQRCVELYPTNASYLAASAEALRLVGRDALAQARIEQALALLAVTTHQDKRIEVLEVLEENAERHPQSPVRRAELARGLWHDANRFTKDDNQRQAKRAEARRVAQTAVRLNTSELRTDTLPPEWLERLRQQMDSPE